MTNNESEIVTMIATTCRGANPQRLLNTPIPVTIDINKNGERGVSCPYANALSIPGDSKADMRIRDDFCEVSRVIICLGQVDGIISIPSFSVPSLSDSQLFLGEVSDNCHFCIQKYPE